MPCILILFPRVVLVRLDVEGVGELDSQVGRSRGEEVDLVLDCIFVRIVIDRKNCLDVLRENPVNVAVIGIRELESGIYCRMSDRTVAEEQCCKGRRKVVLARRNTVAAL